VFVAPFARRAAPNTLIRVARYRKLFSAQGGGVVVAQPIQAGPALATARGWDNRGRIFVDIQSRAFI
jgi:hypothetical protein